MDLDLHASLDMSDVVPPSPPRSPSGARRLSGFAHTGTAVSSTGRRASNLVASFVLSVSQSLSAIPHAASSAAPDAWTLESPPRSPPRTPGRTPSPSLMTPRGVQHEGPPSRAFPDSPSSSLVKQRPSLGERPGTPTSSRDIFVSTAALMVPEYADLEVPVIDAFRVALARRTVSQETAVLELGKALYIFPPEAQKGEFKIVLSTPNELRDKLVVLLEAMADDSTVGLCKMEKSCWSFL